MYEQVEEGRGQIIVRKNLRIYADRLNTSNKVELDVEKLCVCTLYSVENSMYSPS